MKKRVDFFALLNGQCEMTVKAMEVLNQYAQSPTEELSDEIVEIEHAADDIRRTLIEQLNKTYVTPIDREDLFHLSRQLDEILDYAKTSVDEIKLFKIVPNEDMTVITNALLEMAKHIYEAVRNIEKAPHISRDEAIMVKKYENGIEVLTKSAYATLFDSTDFNMIFKYSEIYRHLNHTADVADSAMDFLLDILVKM